MTTIIRRPAEAPCAALALCLALLAGQAGAFELRLPAGARLAAESATEAGSYRLPTATWSEGGIPAERVEGRITRAAWRIEGGDSTPQQILAPLRAQAVAAGYDVLLDCAAPYCGGFDFRFETEVLPGPGMYVDVTDYRFLSARAPSGAALSLLVSRSAAAAFIQIIEAVPTRAAASSAAPDGQAVSETQNAVETPPQTAEPSVSSASLGERLETDGHAVLRDLQFASGASELGADAVGSLDALADYLAANPAARIVFVGHTDASGSLDTNIALSQRRARSAVAYLRDRHGIPAARLDAEGVGYLAPLATNSTEAGRRRNRRIEVVLLTDG